MTSEIKTEIAAATFKRLISHLQEHTEVQNIDLMIYGDFCRNCLAKWYVSAASEQGEDISYEQARELIYGMPYEKWKLHYQLEASSEQIAAYEARQKAKGL
jgi:uncharacterized protein